MIFKKILAIIVVILVLAIIGVAAYLNGSHF